MAVARAATVGGIGIDAEVNRALHPGTWAQFLVDNELQYVRSLPMRSRAGQVLNIWCVKEAATKALREPIDRLEIAVRHEKTLSATQDVWLVGNRAGYSNADRVPGANRRFARIGARSGRVPSRRDYDCWFGLISISCKKGWFNSICMGRDAKLESLKFAGRVMPIDRRYVLISPCRDEADFMRRTLDSVVSSIHSAR